MTERAWVSCVLILLSAALTGCDCSGKSADTTQDPGDAAALIDGSSSTLDGSMSTTDGSSREEFCRGSGSIVHVDVDVEEGNECTGTIAARIFRQAICTCEDLTVQGTLTTDAFDSGTSTTMHGGAAVGANRTFSVAGKVDVGGTLANSPGGSQIGFAGPNNQVRGDLSIMPSLEVAGALDIERDLYAAGAINVRGDLAIQRDLVLPPGSSMSGNITVARETRREAVTVPTACDCTAPLDIAAIVASGVSSSDDGFDRDALASIVGPNHEIEIPCGRFDVSSIGVNGSLTLRVPGRTALFIEGSLTVAGSLAVDLGDTGEIDIFVGGSLTVMGSASFGSPSRPAAVRIYVAQDVQLAGGSQLAGNLYAPNARVAPQGTYEIHGSLFVGTLAAAGDLTVHYDRAILRADEDCDIPPPTGCTECDECGRNACVDGACGACRTDADCCPPLVCYPDGTCGALLF